MIKNIYDFNKEFIYIVDKNDTISKIANKFNTTEQIIIKDNNLRNDIECGDRIYIQRFENVYIVQPDDNLDSIAKKFTINKNLILEKNKIKYIYVGQKIVF